MALVLLTHTGLYGIARLKAISKIEKHAPRRPPAMSISPPAPDCRDDLGLDPRLFCVSPEVAQALRTGRTRRKPRRQPDQRQHRFVDPMIMISERPAEVEDRAVPGHWEGDLIMGEANKTAIATLVERSTRYTLLVHLPDGHHAEAVRDGLIATISRLPTHLRGSLTWDQGCEMARHKQFAMATDMEVYFCDPASPWQRGTNENTNGLVRQYLPKGTDLSGYSQEQLDAIADQINNRPRKGLGVRSPLAVYRELLINSPQHSTLAH
jgi:IS30 family transposase